MTGRLSHCPHPRSHSREHADTLPRSAARFNGEHGMEDMQDEVRTIPPDWGLGRGMRKGRDEVSITSTADRTPRPQPCP